MSDSNWLDKFSEPLNKLLVPVATSAGNTLQDTWELVFGGFGNYVEKKRIVRAKALLDFKNSLEGHVAAIPDERLCEPKLSIVGPALEASKYYFEEPELREMFAKLIAASMDTETTQSVHPSFAEIIKQMSPLDAQNFALFTHQFPVVEYYKTKRGSDSRVTLLSNVFLGNEKQTDLEMQSTSLSSLARLGLVQIEFEKTILAEKFYTEFFTTDYFLRLSAKLEATGYLAGVTFGRAKATPLGKSFMNVCLG